MLKLTIQWIMLTLLDYVLLAPVAYLVAPLIAAFTKAELDEKEKHDYSWGWIFGTYDNPPQGDAGYVTKHCFFPGVVTGLKGYANRVGWMWRNPLYTYQKLAGKRKPEGCKVLWKGNPDISDKYAISGYYFAKMEDYKGSVKAWELYVVAPYTDSKCLRVRLGWKIMTDKLDRFGFAPLVDTITPVKTFGGSVNKQKEK